MKCIENITFDETSCLPKCSGLQCSSYDRDSIDKNNELFENIDIFNSLQLEMIRRLYNEEGWIFPAHVKAWSKTNKIVRNFLNFFLKGFSKLHQTKLQDEIEKLSEKYWKFKGYFSLKREGLLLLRKIDINYVFRL